MNDVLHVVAAVIRDQSGKVLIAKRAADKHQGGKWEFPGGKVDARESPIQALSRELDEELGVQVVAAQPLIKIQHDYPEQSVLLDIWEVTKFTGEAFGKEGQPIKWVESADLAQYEFPDANIPIITAANLPSACLITPEPRHETNFLEKLEVVLASGIFLVQFRAKELSNADYMDLARITIKLVHKYKGKILLNSPPLWIKEADGMHLSSQILENTPYRPSLEPNKLVTAACHNQAELEKSAYIRADALFVSPVKKTASHPTAEPLGWGAFKNLTEQAKVPVYALGGLGLDDIQEVRKSGGQGVAAISAIWR